MSATLFKFFLIYFVYICAVLRVLNNVLYDGDQCCRGNSRRKTQGHQQVVGKSSQVWPKGGQQELYLNSQCSHWWKAFVLLRRAGLGSTRFDQDPACVCERTGAVCFYRAVSQAPQKDSVLCIHRIHNVDFKVHDRTMIAWTEIS